MRQLAAILLLPGLVTVAIPAIMILQSRGARLGWGLPWPASLVPLLGALLLAAAGLSLVYGTVRLFATHGQGTLAPWDPTQRLVVRGVYRHVRNPMITGVFLILAGEALFFGVAALLYWFLFAVAVNLIYIPLLEEPGLEQRFGDDYRSYKQNVPRWIPRWRPWQGPPQP